MGVRMRSLIVRITPYDIGPLLLHGLASCGTAQHEMLLVLIDQGEPFIPLTHINLVPSVAGEAELIQRQVGSSPEPFH